MAKINITGIDDKAPITKVTIPSGWATSKIITLETKDEGIGTAIKPYKYNEEKK
jgi:hypothetical protein